MDIDKIKQIASDKYGKELTDKQAAQYAEKFGKLSDDELDNTSGGYGYCDSEFHYGKYCESCEVWCDRIVKVDGSGGSGHCTFGCPVCGTIYG